MAAGNTYLIKKIKKGSYKIIKNGREWGNFNFSVQEAKKKKRRFTYFSHDIAPKRIEYALLRLILEEFLMFDPASNFLAFPSKNGIYDKIAKKLKAEIGSDQIHLELKIENAKKKTIEKWANEIPAKYPELELKLFTKFPDDVLEKYCISFSELLKDMPANSELYDTTVKPAQIRSWQKRDEKTGDITYIYLLFDKHERIVAMTNVAVTGKDKTKAHQFMTGVARKHRGKGFGKWLKAVMFKRLIKDFPDLKLIRTETHPQNHGSREISLKMGYVQTAVFKEFKISRDQAEKFIKK